MPSATCMCGRSVVEAQAAQAGTHRILRTATRHILFPMAREPRLVSVVAPMFDGEETVDTFYERTRAALGDVPFELILVGDASRDGTPEALDRLADSDPRVRVLHLSRNFGHQAAITAGLEHARGD